jgi:hypothetical protein
VNLRIGSIVCHLFNPPNRIKWGKAGGRHILRWQEFAVKYYGFTLAALALEPSEFCNNRVDTGAGKTKTTANTGLALRSAGMGLKACFAQFIRLSALQRVQDVGTFPVTDHSICPCPARGPAKRRIFD